MVRVGSHDEFTAVEMKFETTYGTDPTWAADVFKVPHTGESLHYEVTEFPASEEFGTLGGLQSVDQGRRVVEGSMTFEPAYDTVWFWRMFSQAWGAENLVLDQDMEGVAELTMNTHFFSPGTGLPVGLALRVWKGGSATGTVDTILGLIVTRMVWNQPRNNRATVTLDFLGKSITSAAPGGSPVALEASPKKFKALDLQRAGSLFWLGTTMGTFNAMGFSLTIDRKLQITDAFLQSLLVADKPLISGTREVTLEIDTDLESDYNSANKPWFEFLAGLTSSCSIFYDSGVAAVAARNYRARIDLPAITYLAADNSIKQAGAQPFPIRAKAQVGPLSNLDSLADHVTIPASGSVDVRFGFQVAQGDEPALDTKFSNLANG